MGGDGVTRSFGFIGSDIPETRVEGTIMTREKIRVLLAKKRIDVHGRGTKLIARELRDAGMEVIYYRYGTP